MATEEGEKLYTTAVHSDSPKTFVFVDEDHTLGNSLRYVIMRDPATTFCGYTIPHPSENKMHLRVQTNGKTAEKALVDGANTLDNMCDTILNKFEEALSHSNN